MAVSKNKLVFQLEKNKVTKGAIRFGDDEGHSIYLRKEEVPSTWKDKVTVTIESK